MLNNKTILMVFNRFRYWSIYNLIYRYLIIWRRSNIRRRDCREDILIFYSADIAPCYGCFVTPKTMVADNATSW